MVYLKNKKKIDKRKAVKYNYFCSYFYLWSNFLFGPFIKERRE